MRARIATICQAGRIHHSVEENRNYVMKLLDLALSQKPDLVCLPEAFTTAGVNKPKEEIAEPVPGPTTSMVAKKAREHNCYIICPIITKRDGKIWNSAVIIDREGEVLGIYDKVHPVTSSSDYTVFENGVTPGKEAPVFDLDFGRIGIQICFDIGFPETWQKLADRGAKIVFWPSAYNGGFPLQAYAYLHHYYVVSSVRADKSRIIDPLGRILAETDFLLNVIYRDINPDFVVAHYDFNHGIPDEIMKAYPGRVKIVSSRDAAHFLVEPIDDALTTEQLMREFGFESTFQYHERHRIAYRWILQGKRPPPQKAAHGERAQYSK
ncbi:carbon-nitrogen hydrolase family protein [Candidatus Bathyarchaeota archaeon]|nr:carbon-nitrogen hydrolase family protein [Candidatus Bathyarchaeota archaeon]